MCDVPMCLAVCCMCVLLTSVSSSLDGGWIVKKVVGGRPAILGQKITQYYFKNEELNYMEVRTAWSKRGDACEPAPVFLVSGLMPSLLVAMLVAVLVADLYINMSL